MTLLEFDFFFLIPRHFLDRFLILDCSPLTSSTSPVNLIHDAEEVEGEIKSAFANLVSLLFISDS